MDWDYDRAPSLDWCCYRRASHCYYPDDLDEEATAEAGYTVWIPVDRGPCWRIAWKGKDGQQGCDLAQPGPNSKEPVVYLDATISWGRGGQRMPEVALRPD